MRILILAYPVLVHVAVVRESTWLMALSLLLLAGAMLEMPLRAGRAWAAITLLLAVAAAAGLAWLDSAIYLLFLPPVLVSLFLLQLFARSLRPGRTPLITAVALAIRGSLPDELAVYTRNLTLAWALMMGAMAVWSTAAAILAPHETWSLITNLVNYLVIAVFGLVEYGWRRWRYRHLPHPTVRDYVTGISRVDFRNS